MSRNSGFGRETSKKQPSIRAAESHFFTGRKPELERLICLTGIQRPCHLINIHGTGGIGKTTLLREFETYAKRQGNTFLLMDGESAFRSPSQFLEELSFQLKEYGLPAYQPYPSESLAACLTTLKSAAETGPVLLAVDSYEHAGYLDSWFRREIAEPLLPEVPIILAGRHRLKGDWLISPAWREVTQELELKAFDHEQTHSYLAKFGIESSQAKTIWQFTKGHPLTLSLVAGLPVEAVSDLGRNFLETGEIFEVVVRRWLTEVEDRKLYKFIEAACILHEFDQAALSALLQTDIDSASFYDFIGYSFVKKVKSRWMLHELFRNCASQDLKKRNPEKYQLLSQRAIQHYVKRLMSSSRSEADFAELFYHIGNEKIKAAFFQDVSDKGYYIEKAEQKHKEEIEAYFAKRKLMNNEDNADFCHWDARETVRHFVSKAHNAKETELFFDSEVYKELDHGVFRLLKNRDGKTIGLSAVIPVCAATLQYLKTKPVSRAYFRHLSFRELQEYNSADGCAGWFIRMIDCLDPADAQARSCLLYELFPLLLSGGRILVSTPLPFYQHLLREFGFKEVPGAIHYDYGMNQPSPTYLLDVRGSRLADYLRELIEPVMQSPVLSATALFKFTEREREIIELVVMGYQNGEIAEKLFVTEVTIKKHMTRILRKVQVRNRSQLVRRIMETSALPFH